MSIVSTAANYGGRVAENQTSVKQFYVSDINFVSWIYKKLSSGLRFITPSNQKYPVLINNDLIVTGSIYNISDLRLKKNISKIEEKKIKDIFSLNPIHYQFKNNASNKIHYGFIAQEVEKIYPELIEENISGFKTVNYQEIIPLMLSKMI